MALPRALIDKPFASHLLLLLAIFCFHAPGLATEDYYRWQDREGNTHYGDQPPADTIAQQPLQLSLPSPLYTVRKVIDGDTIVVANSGKVRLLGINTPEIEHRDRAGEPLGEEARLRLQQILNGQRVRLQFDEVQRDRFKRLLAYVYLEDGTPVNEILLREGMARALFLQPNMAQLEHYYQIEGVARDERRGIWSLPQYQIKPTSKAKECIKQFCRLRGRVLKVEQTPHYIDLFLSGNLHVAIATRLLPQFESKGIHPGVLKGKSVVVRGWLGRRQGRPYLRLQHPLQIEPLL